MDPLKWKFWSQTLNHLPILQKKNSQPPVPVPEPIPVPQPTPEPSWITISPIRQVNSSIGGILADIDSHMPAGHIYRDADKVTWGHETTHGLNARIRNQHGSGTNVFYCLNNRAAVIREPPTTIRAIAGRIPHALRGRTTYGTYMVQSLGDWNNQPLYICDEWVAYTNGTAVGIDLDKKGMWRDDDRSCTVDFMLEFDAYMLCLAQEVSRLSNYDDTQFKAFMMWNLERTMRFYKESKNTQNFKSRHADAYWAKVKVSSLNQFAKSYFGAEWCKKVLGF